MDMNSGGLISPEGGRTGHSHPASDVDAIPLSSLSAKGDLIVATGPGEAYILPVGQTGTALTPSSSSPVGVAWTPVAQSVHTHTQAQSHNSADTDAAVTSLHHTIGTGATQAAAGNHKHTDIVPIGAVMPYAGTTAPANYLMCDGSVVSQTTYAGLFAVCGFTYGTAPTGMFRLPDLQGRAPYGYTAGVAEFNAMAKAGGVTTVTLTTSNLPSHTHTVAAHTHTTSTHTHSVGAHTHSTPDHSHTVSVGRPGDHTHSVSATTGDPSTAHQHDTRIDSQTNFSRGSSYSGAGATVATTNTSNLTANGGGVHTHPVTVIQSNAGDHQHTLTWTSSGAGTSGSASATAGDATVTVNNAAAAETAATGTGAVLTTVSPYLVLRYIIKAL